MELGCFSISLTVRDLQKSKEFYQSLGFTVFHGQADQGWLIMKNGACNLGLFQGMFEKNILTFNPGWDQDANQLEHFKDVRQIQESLQASGIKLSQQADPGSTGPASITLEDPDGNQILIDQHV